MSEPHVFRYDTGRLARNLTGLLPLAGFPVVLHLSGREDPVLYTLFGVAAVVLIAYVVYYARRFKLTVDDTVLAVRGRVRHRKLNLAEIKEARVRRGREKAQRFMGPPPFRELVLRTGAAKPVVVSSLPLGEERFEDVLGLLAERIPDEVWTD